MRIIGEYLPYSVRIGLLESKKKTYDILSKMGVDMTFIFLEIISRDQDWLNILPYEDRMKEFRDIRDNTGQLVPNPLYSPFSSRSSKKAEDIRRIKYILNVAKEVNPKFAYNTIKMFHILFNQNKNYRINYNNIKIKPITLGI